LREQIHSLPTRQIVCQYGTTGVYGNGHNQLNNPNCGLLLENGHILICICDGNNNRAIEVTHANPNRTVWQYGSRRLNLQARLSQPQSDVSDRDKPLRV
jgi:hypothetical protein